MPPTTTTEGFCVITIANCSLAPRTLDDDAIALDAAIDAGLAAYFLAFHRARVAWVQIVALTLPLGAMTTAMAVFWFFVRCYAAHGTRPRVAR